MPFTIYDPIAKRYKEVGPEEFKRYLATTGYKYDPEAEMGTEAFERYLIETTTPEESELAELSRRGLGGQLLSPRQTAEYGFQMPEGWLLQLIPDQLGGYTQTLITPQKQQVRFEDIRVEETGEWFTAQQLAERPPETILGFNIQELLQRLAVTEGMPTFERMRAEQEQLDFLESMAELGRTGETEALLRSVFQEVTEEQLRGVFGEPAIERVIPGAFTLEGEYIPENWFKDFFDALYVATHQTIYKTKEYFLGVLPEVMFKEIKAGDLKSIVGGVPNYYTEEEATKLNTRHEVLRREYKQKYVAAQEENEKWFKSLPPELQPKPEYTQLVTENWGLLKDPGYWLYSIGEALPYTLGAMAVGFGTLYATKNPLLAMAATTAVVTPVATQDVFDDLVASGANKEEAAELAIPVGTFIAMLESAANLLTLGIASAPLKIMRTTLQKGIIGNIARWVVKRGPIASMAAIWIEETFTEDLQTFTQNLAVKTVDENRGLFENVLETTVKTIVITSPFALFGGGTAMRYVPPDMAQTVPDSRKKSEGWEYDEIAEQWSKPTLLTEIYEEHFNNLVKEGLTEEQARLKALNELARTPEGEKAISEAAKKIEEGVPPEVKYPAIPERSGLPILEEELALGTIRTEFERLIREGKVDLTAVQAQRVEMLVDRGANRAWAIQKVKDIVSELKREVPIEAVPEVTIRKMTYEERLIEATKLEQENKAILATPSPSAGEISPAQLGMMSPNEHARYMRNLAKKIEIESQIKALRRTDEEIARAEAFQLDKEIRGRIAQLERQIADLKSVGISIKTGKMRPSYQRAIDAAELELKELTEARLPRVERELKPSERAAFEPKPPAVEVVPEKLEVEKPVKPTEETPVPPEGATKRVFNRIETEPAELGIREKIRKGWHKFNVKMIDDLYAVNQFVKEFRKGGVELSIEENPYLLARLLKGITSKSTAFLEKGTFGKKFWKIEKGKAVPNFTGESLETILQEVRDPTQWRDFSTYLTSRRVVQLDARDIKTGIELVDAQASIIELEAKYKNFPDLARRVYKYQDSLLVYASEMGLVGKDLLGKLRKYGDYVPFYRVFNELQAKGFMGKKMANIASPIKRIKGSEREIVNPLESIVKNTYTIINAADRNQIGIAMANLVDQNPEISALFERIQVPMARVARVDAKELGLEIEGLSDEDADLVVDIFRPSFFVRGDEITVLMDGKKAYFRLDPDLRDALLTLDRENIGLIGKILGYPAKWLRAGATLSPDFMVRNPARDQMTAFAYSNYGFLPGIDFMRGVAGIVSRDQDYQLFRMSGAEHSMMVSMDRQYLKKTFKEIVEGKKFKDYVKHPLELFQIISELGEKATRLGEFKNGIRRGAVPLKAGLSARNVSLDFAQAGTTSRAVNRLIAFFNANVRGWDRMITSFREHPTRTAMKVFVGITLPSILLYLANRDDERWKEIPQWQKDLFWIVMTEDAIYRIPKPFELGIIFGSMPERFLEWLDTKDPKMLKEVMLNMAEAGSPGFIPTALLPIIENLANYSFFRGRSIVPASREQMPPELQYTRWTGEFSKKLGEMLKMSPAKIDNLINGWTGGLGRYATDILGLILKGTGISPNIPKPSPTLADIPVLRAFVVRNPFGSSSEAVNDLYETLEKYTEGERYLKEMLSLGDIEKFEEYKAAHPELLFFYDFENDVAYSASARYLRRVARDLSELRKKEDEIYKSKTIGSAEKRKLIDEIDKVRWELARRAMNLFLGDIPTVIEAQLTEAENRLGEVIEDVPLLSLDEPDIFDIRSLSAEYGRILEAVPAEAIVGKPGVPSTVGAWYEKEESEKKQLSLVNTLIYKVDTDKEFDLLTKRQKELFRKYQAADEETQERLLIEFPELKVNPQLEWLKANSMDNARLAIWGQAKILSLEAYNEVNRLIKELDIPDAAIVKFTLPPATSIETHFAYEEMVAGGKHNSWEAQLLLLKDAEAAKKTGVQPYAGEGGFRDDLQLSDTPISLLELKVANRESFDKYEAYGDENNIELYIADDTEREKARRELLFSKSPIYAPGELTDFGKAYYTSKASSEGYSENKWSQFVEFSTLPQWGSWRDRFLIDPVNAGFYAEYTNLEIGNHGLVTVVDVKPVRRDEIYGQFLDEYKAWDEIGGMTESQIKTMHNKLKEIIKDSMSFNEARYRVDAYDVFLSENLIDTYVEWYTSPTLKKPDDYEDKLGWYEDDWFLQEHPEFYREMRDKGVFTERRDYRKVPSREVFDLWVIYNSLPYGTVRKDYRRAHRDLDDWGVRAGKWKPIEGEIEDAEALTKWEKLAEELAELEERARKL